MVTRHPLQATGTSSDIATLACFGSPGRGGQCLLVRHGLDHHGSVHAKRTAQGILELSGLLDAYAYASERFRRFCEIRVLLKTPDIIALRTAAPIDRVDQGYFLVEPGIVIHYDNDVDAVARGGFQLGKVIVHAAVAGEANDRAVRQRAFDAK